MKTTCTTPETPEFYKEQIEKDIRATFEHALDMLKKCDAGSGEAEFYMDIVKANEVYHCGG